MVPSMLVLASKSASRRAMLEAAGIPHRAVPADLDERNLESALTDAAPGEVARALARAKALAVSAVEPQALVLGSDSLVECGGRRFDKPESREEAAEHLHFFSGKVMNLHSAAAIVEDGKVLWSATAQARLTVARLSDPFVDAYLDEEWPEVGHCVGVFRIEGRGVRLFEAIEGDYFTILGMPLLQVQSFLREFGALT